MLEKAELLSYWEPLEEGDQAETVITVYPGIYFSFPGILNYREITGNVPNGPTDIKDPNNFVLYFEADTAVMDQVANDPDFTILEGTRGPV
jgi:hypothetical protein